MARLAEPHRLHGRRPGLRGRDRRHLGADAFGADIDAAVRGHERRHAVVVRVARRHSRHRYRGRAHQPRGDAWRRRQPLAGPGAARRRSGRAAHAAGNARDAELARRGRGTSAPARDPLPRLAGRPAALRAVVGLVGCQHRAHRHRRRVGRHRGAGCRAAEPPLRPGRGWRTIPAAASPAHLVRERTALDGMGAKTRQTAGTQSPAPRRHRHHVHHEHGPLALGAGRRALRAHAGRRHAPAARNTSPAHRQDGASAQSPALRCAPRTRGRGLRHPATARRLLAAHELGGHVVSARILGRRRRRPVCRRGFRRLPGFVR